MPGPRSTVCATDDGQRANDNRRRLLSTFETPLPKLQHEPSHPFTTHSRGDFRRARRKSGPPVLPKTSGIYDSNRIVHPPTGRLLEFRRAFFQCVTIRNIKRVLDFQQSTFAPRFQNSDAQTTDFPSSQRAQASSEQVECRWPCDRTCGASADLASSAQRSRPHVACPTF
jgi:hypothetical protein